MFLLLAAVAAGCGPSSRSPNATVSPAPATPAVEAATAQNGADLLTAFRVAFGAPAPYVTKVNVGDQYNPELETLSFTPQAFINLGPGLVALVSKGEGASTGNDAHASAGALTVHYLRLDQNGFTLLGRWTVPGSGIGYGLPAPWTLRSDLDDDPVMLLQAEDSGMGCYGETDTLFALTPTGPEKRVSFLRISENKQDDASSSSQNFKYDGAIVPIARGASFAVDYTGTLNKRVVFTKMPDGTFMNTADPGSTFPPGC
jgi:hypothetical protein